MTPPGSIPGDTPPPAAPLGTAMPPHAPIPTWQRKAAAVLFITFCLEMGFFLLIFPWIDNWDRFANFIPKLRPLFENLYMRGAVSGLGIVNLYISLSELLRLRRFARPR